MKRFEIWECTLPEAIGSEQGGKRPVLIIQNDIGNKHSTTTIVAPITSKHKNRIPTHVNVPKKIGLSSDSTILFEQIVTVDKIRMIHKICDLPDVHKEKCVKAMLISLGIIEKWGI